MRELENSFLHLVRLGIGHVAEVNPQPFYWKEIETLANRHGLLAVIVDGIEKLSSNVRLPQELLLEWIGDVLQGYEYCYEQYSKAIAELAEFYNTHGYKMMVLKGYACSLDWPRPEHRPCGDIDIWLFGKQKEADKVLGEWSKEHGSRLEIDKSHHHHTVFEWDGFTVENHYDFVNVHAHRSSAELEKVFKELGKDDSYSVEVIGKKVYLPSPNLHALFLIKHMVSHFAAAEINLRQVLDWAFFVEKHTKEIDWNWLNRMMEDYHIKDFVSCINAICVEELGFEAYLFHVVQFNPALKEKVLADILNPKFPRKEPQWLIPRLVFKYRRWKGNAWKHELCYKESMSSSFISGIWNHLLKPRSI